MRDAIYNLYNYMELGSKTFEELLYTTRRFYQRENGQSSAGATTEVKVRTLGYRILNLTTTKMQTKINPKYHFTPIRMATFHFGNAKSWQRCGRGISMYGWRQYKVVSTEF